MLAIEDTAVIDEIASTGATVADVATAVAQSEQVVCYDEVCFVATPSRISRLRALITRVLRGPDNILRGRD